MQRSTKKLSSKKPSRKQVLSRGSPGPAAAIKRGVASGVRPEDYQVVLEWSDDDACFIATIPAWNQVRTHGSTASQALRNAQQVLQLLIETAQTSGEVMPEPQRAYSGKLQLRLPSSLHRRLAREAEREGVSLNHWLTAKLAC
jgi:antitoxin HicB